VRTSLFLFFCPSLGSFIFFVAYYLFSLKESFLRFSSGLFSLAEGRKSYYIQYLFLFKEKKIIGEVCIGPN